MAEALLPLDVDDKLRFFLGDVRDEPRLAQAFWGCGTVIHTAALKRVDKVAYDPEEATKTNVIGSANVIRAAVKAGVVRVLMISSDKAVNPSNFYGVTKQMMEQEAIAANAWTYPQGTRVSCTRWGNVAGSRGSVIHVFQRAIAQGKPIPITDPRCTRFWLTLGDAVGYVQEALRMMQGGEIFVPAGLPSARVVDVAEALAPGHPQMLVGLRPGGEKVHEVLATESEVRRSVYVGNHTFVLIPPTTCSWGWSPVWVNNGPHYPQLHEYASDTTPFRLDQSALKDLLERVGGEE